MRLALIFPGQGVQHAAMLRWLDDDPAAASVLESMANRIGGDWRLRLTDPVWSSSNPVAQCLMTGTSLAAWQTLRARLPKPVAVAGYSVGELAAFAAADAFDAEAALDLAALRADAMDRAAASVPGSLMSVIGPTPEVIETVCRDSGCAVAIRIATDRVVLGGALDALARAEALLRQGHADIARLPVRVASHTTAMREAADVIARALAALPWRAPRVPLITGRDGIAVRGIDALKLALAEQTSHTVQWQAAMQTIAERRPSRVLEIGAGSSLSRIWRAAQPDIDVRSADEFASADAVAAWALRP